MAKHNINKALVTGATGFIGNRLCELLRAGGVRVVGTARTCTPGNRFDFIACDLAEALPTGLLDEVDTVFHLAGKAHALSEVKEDEEEYFDVNVTGTKILITKCEEAKVKKVVYFSSVKAMGEGNADYPSTDPIDETFDCLPSSPYGASKREAERLVFSSENRFECTVIRPCLVYGPGSKGNLTKMAEAIRKKRFPPIPEFDNMRSIVHVDDLCQLALSAATNPKASGEVLIAAEPQAYSTREIYELMLDAMNKKQPSWTIPAFVLKAMGWTGDLIGKLRGKRFVFDSDALNKLSEDAHYDGSKATKLLGFEYTHSLGPSLIDMLKSE